MDFQRSPTASKKYLFLEHHVWFFRCVFIMLKNCDLKLTSKILDFQTYFIPLPNKRGTNKNRKYVKTTNNNASGGRRAGYRGGGGVRTLFRSGFPFGLGFGGAHPAPLRSPMRGCHCFGADPSS